MQSLRKKPEALAGDRNGEAVIESDPDPPKQRSNTGPGLHHPGTLTVAWASVRWSVAPVKACPMSLTS